MSQQLFSAVSLFSGAGGLDIGLEQSGFELISAMDFDSNCAATLRENQKQQLLIPLSNGRKYLEKTKIIHGDIQTISGRDLIPSELGARWTPDLLVGGPPCQPFSSAGKQRGLDDPRGTLFHHFVRIAKELRPKFILFENVRGLVTARGASGEPGEVLLSVRREFEAAGYATRFSLLNSADFGAPQRRVRLFMIASRVSALPEFPLATHSSDAESDDSLPWVSLGDFLAKASIRVEDKDVIRPSENLATQLKDVPNGSGLKSAGARETTRPGGHWGYKQGTFVANPALPARTVTAASTQDWIRLPDGSLRRLAWKECAAIQGFPSKWKFIGDRSSVYRQIGNAVPTIFGRVVGRTILHALQVGARSQKLESAPFPTSIDKAIRYTLREGLRNGESRQRVRAELASGGSANTLKGLGSISAQGEL